MLLCLNLSFSEKQKVHVSSLQEIRIDYGRCKHLLLGAQGKVVNTFTVIEDSNGNMHGTYSQAFAEELNTVFWIMKMIV